MSNNYNYDNLLKERRENYLNGDIEIISSNIKNKVNPNNPSYVNKLAKISLIIDEKLKIKNITDRQKELIVEGTMSAYEYLNKNHNRTFDSFEKHISEHLKKIQTLKLYGNGLYVFRNINLNKEIVKNSEVNSDEKFLLTYTHELCHCLSDDYKNKTSGLLKGKYTLINYVFNKNPRNYKNIDEMQTEFMTHEILKNNFPDFIKRKEMFEDKFQDKVDTRIKISSIGYSYNYITPYAENINYLYGDFFKNMYFNNTLKINEIEDKELSNICNKISKNYDKYTKKMILENYFKIEDSFVDIVQHYFNNNEVSDEEYFKITDKLLENPRIIQCNDVEININESSVGLLDLKRFNKEISNPSREEIIDMLIELNESKGSIYKNDKGLYNFLNDIKDVRNKDLEINDFKEKYNEKDFEIEF